MIYFGQITGINFLKHFSQTFIFGATVEFEKIFYKLFLLFGQYFYSYTINPSQVNVACGLCKWGPGFKSVWVYISFLEMFLGCVCGVGFFFCLVRVFKSFWNFCVVLKRTDLLQHLRPQSSPSVFLISVLLPSQCSLMIKIVFQQVSLMFGLP